MLRGAEVARAEVSDITGVLLWPGRMTWVGPETITSLIEAHGVAPGSLLRPGWQGEVGWPVLLPISAVEHLRAVSPERMPADIVDEVAGYVTTQVVDVGDPGIHFDADTPIGELPPYEGPPEPPGGHRHEWGDAVAEGGVDEAIPGEGRGLAPYPQAADDAAVDLD
jgi:hypothetical protein